MAVSATHLETTGNVADLTSYATGSQTPTANRLQLMWVYTIAAGAPNIPTASGAGLTWVVVDSILDTSALRRLTLFRALGASPSTGVVTIDFAGQLQAGAAWSWSEFDGVNQGGTNGSAAIVQDVTASTPGNATSLTVTLGAFASASNATAGGFGFPLNTAAMPNTGTGFTLLGRRNQGTPNLSAGSEWRSDNSTAVDANTGAASVPWVGIAVEIAAVSMALSASVDSTTSFTASLSVARPLAASVSSSTNFSATLSRAMALSASVSSGTAFSAALSLGQGLQAAVASATSFTGALGVRRALAADFTGPSSITALLGVRRGLAAAFASASSFQGTLTLNGILLVANFASASKVKAYLILLGPADEPRKVLTADEKVFVLEADALPLGLLADD